MCSLWIFPYFLIYYHNSSDFIESPSKFASFSHLNLNLLLPLWYSQYSRPVFSVFTEFPTDLCHIYFIFVDVLTGFNSFLKVFMKFCPKKSRNAQTGVYSQTMSQKCQLIFQPYSIVSKRTKINVSDAISFQFLLHNTCFSPKYQVI